MILDNKILDELVVRAKKNPRLRQNYDLRTSPEDQSQRMLNAIEPGSVVPIHRHPKSTETVCVLRGTIRQSFYEEDASTGELQLVEQYTIDAGSSCPMYVVPVGMWHTSEALVSGTIIFEAKDGAYGKDGSETLSEFQKGSEPASVSEGFKSLKEQITYLIGMERQSGSMDNPSALYISRMLNVPIEEVEMAMKEMGI